GQLSQFQMALQGKEQDIQTLHQQVRTESEQKVAAQTRLNEAQASLEDQKKLLEEAKRNLTDTFKALAADTLRDTHGEFLMLAKSEFAKAQAEATGELELRQKSIEGLVNPLKESLNRYEREIQEVERSRGKAYASLEEQVRSLQKVATSLDTALRTPQVRGQWGEMTLRNAAELAGMSEHCDFTEQETVTSESRRLRPDLIVRLPGGRRIAVDAKAPLQGFLDAQSATSEADRKAHLARHAQQVRSHMHQLSAKNYWEQFDPAPDLVVLFLPGESFFSAALEQDRTLIEEGLGKRVLLATPTTFIALLRSVAYSWQQQRLSESAWAIRDLGKEMYGRMKTFADYFAGVGDALGKAVESYNKATGSLESRLLVAARKFKEYGAGGPEEIAILEPVEDRTRSLSAPEWDEDSVARNPKRVPEGDSERAKHFGT
ncbi:MAG: DNA recombination protein RmuC, partial [Terriglobia bacterium]